MGFLPGHNLHSPCVSDPHLPLRHQLTSLERQVQAPRLEVRAAWLLSTRVPFAVLTNISSALYRHGGFGGPSPAWCAQTTLAWSGCLPAPGPLPLLFLVNFAICCVVG